MRRVIFQADEELLSRAKQRAHERGVSIAQVVRDALEADLRDAGTRPPPTSIIGIGISGRRDLSELASNDAYEPEPWVSS
ncbi:MAG TPA: hypothetical protein VMD09_02180 [Solirubrobacteraceae bacterium]|nr:hypothetical protein [Solirubrobacteraceae bacterium]